MIINITQYRLTYNLTDLIYLDLVLASETLGCFQFFCFSTDLGLDQIIRLVNLINLSDGLTHILSYIALDTPLANNFVSRQYPPELGRPGSPGGLEICTFLGWELSFVSELRIR